MNRELVLPGVLGSAIALVLKRFQSGGHGFELCLKTSDGGSKLGCGRFRLHGRRMGLYEDAFSGLSVQETFGSQFGDGSSDNGAGNVVLRAQLGRGRNRVSNCEMTGGDLSTEVLHDALVLRLTIAHRCSLLM